MALKADETEDVALNQDRQVHLDQRGDLDTVSGLAAVQQSVAIHAGDVLRPLIGAPLTSNDRLGRIETDVRSVLRNDVQIRDVQDVELVKIDRQTNTVTFEIILSFDNTFTIDVPAD